ncbi:MAG: iron chaperone [Thermoplasmatota archaeon]
MAKETTKSTKKPAKVGGRTGTATGGFTSEERAAMKARAQELKAEARGKQAKADGEKDVLAAIAAMPEPDRSLAQRVHAIVKSTAPDITPKTWYGFPAYAQDDSVVCFFKPASKFKERYASLGFNETAKLDEGNMWPTSYAITKLTPAEEAKIAALVKKALK